MDTNFKIVLNVKLEFLYRQNRERKKNESEKKIRKKKCFLVS